MKKLSFVLGLFFLFVGWNLFAHTAGDMLVGLELGVGYNKIGDMSGMSSYPIEYYQLTRGIISKDEIAGSATGMNYHGGVSFDYYFLSWLSASSGLSYHGTINFIDYYLSNSSIGLFDIGAPYQQLFHRGYLKIPLAAHANFSALYFGIGLAYNLQLFQRAEYGYEFKADNYTFYSAEEETLDYSSGSFLEFYVDFGIDFMHRKTKDPGEWSLGHRLFARYSPALTVSSPKDKNGSVIVKDLKSMDISLIYQFCGAFANKPIFK